MATNKVCFRFAFVLDFDETKGIYMRRVAPPGYYQGTRVRAGRSPGATTSVAPCTLEISESELTNNVIYGRDEEALRAEG